MNKINFEKEKFIEDYYRLKSSRKMGEYYGCSKTTILNYAKSINFNPNQVQEYKLSQQDKEDIIAAYDTKTSTELAQQYNVSRGMITKLWYDAGLRGKTVENAMTNEIDMTGQKIGKWTVLYKADKKGASGIIYWHCQCDCGQEKDVSGLSLRQHRSLSCGLHSNVSRGNEKIAKILDEQNILYEREKTFDSCKDQKVLPFDFYINNQYLIEYDGEQHFTDIPFFDFQKTHNHDLIKNQWCKEHNIPLIRIPYTAYNNLAIEDLLLETSPYII